MKNTVKSIKLLAVFLTAFLLVFGCKKEDEETTPFILGAIYDLTGPQSALDIPSSRGAQLAIDEANAAGGIDSQTIELILKDGKTDIDVLRMDVAELLRQYPGTAAFLGLSDTDQVLAAAAEAAGQQRVFLTSGATSPQLPAQVPDYLFLACFGDNVQAAAAAEWAYNEKDARTAAVIFDSTQTYTRLLQGYFLTRFTELGGQITSVTGYDQQDLSNIAAGIQGVDLVFLAAMPQDALEGIEKIRLAGFAGPILGGDSFDSETLWSGNPGIEDVFFTTHAYLGSDNPDARVQAFREAYRGAFNGEEPSAFAALGYDAARLLVSARQIAKSNAPEAILSALASVQNFDGVTGTISYDAGSRIPKKSVTIMKVAQGATTLEMVVMPQSVPAP